MLKNRLIPVLFIKDGFIVRSEAFKTHKIIGNVVNEVQRYSQWNVDELIYIDISSSGDFNSGRDDHKVPRVTNVLSALELLSKYTHMPLAFGGGIRDLETIKKYISAGADKIIVNTLIFEDPNILREAVSIYGSQAVICCIDYTYCGGAFEFFSNSGTVKQDCTPDQLVQRLEKIGCGEVMLHNIARDGAAEGFDEAGICELTNLMPMPVIICGGAGAVFDFEEIAAVQGISAVAAGNFFHFTENAYPRVKAKLKDKGFNYR